MLFQKKHKFTIDPITLTVTKSVSAVKKSYKVILSGLGISLILGGCMALVFFNHIGTPEDTNLTREINGYQLKIQLLDNKIDKTIEILESLQTKDDRTYRTIFGMDPLSKELRNAGIGGVDQYAAFDVVENGKILKNTAAKIDLIKRKTLIQSESFNNLEKIVSEKEKMLASIPSIMPVNRNSIRFSSNFGWRKNPFSRRGSQFHPGIDMAGKVGTPIYATGDGVVIDPLSPMTGYGNVLVVDHGYGYRTLYAHLSKKIAKVGDHVKRGEVIALLGNTGPSTGPHLHYEVIRNGQKVNPVNYIYSGFSSKEFQEIVDAAENAHE